MSNIWFSPDAVTSTISRRLKGSRWSAWIRASAASKDASSTILMPVNEYANCFLAFGMATPMGFATMVCGYGRTMPLSYSLTTAFAVWMQNWLAER